MLLPKVLAKSKHFEPTAHVQDLAEYASPIVSCGNQTGEGWFLTGEMLELINEGVMIYPRFTAALLRLGDVLDVENNRFSLYSVEHMEQDRKSTRLNSSH